MTALSHSLFEASSFTQAASLKQGSGHLWPFRRGGFQTRQLTGGIHKSFRAVILWRKDCIRGCHDKPTFISNMMCCMLCTVNTDLIWSHFFLAYRNGSDLHGYLHIGQEREIQTQVVTWDTFETNSGAVSQRKSGSTQSRHSQDSMYWFCSIWWIFIYFFTIYFNAYFPCVLDIVWQPSLFG